MEGESKKFTAAEITIALLIAGTNSILKTVADLSLGVPVLGEIVLGAATLYTVFAWGITLGWFILKLGVFGVVGLAMTVGGVLDFFGIPIGLLGGTLLAIFLTNHPKAKAVAGVVAAGAGGAAGAAEGAGAAAVGEEAAATAAKTGAEAGAAGAGEGMVTKTSVTTESGTVTGETPSRPEGTGVNQGIEGESAATGEAGAETQPGGEKPAIEPEALGEERELLGSEGGEGKLEKELFEEPVKEPSVESEPESEPEGKSKWKERLKDIADKIGQDQQGNSGDEEEEEENIEEAA